MAKYHLDPAGNPGICKATKRCPFGGDLQKDHYPSEAVARKAYELENETHPLEFDDKAKEVFEAIGPRQLPNRMWATLRHAIMDNEFSEHDLNIAVVAINEEWQKHAPVLAKHVRDWDADDRHSATVVANIGRLAAILSNKAESWEKERHDRLEKEFAPKA
jgi:hypothetical protein